MIPLSPDDQRHVEAAKGWLGLGDWRQANEELELVEPELRASPQVLDVRWRVYAQAGKWETAVELAGVVMQRAPNRRVETMYALAVHGCRLNRADEARIWLREAVELGGDEMKLRALDDPGLEKVWAEG